MKTKHTPVHAAIVSRRNTKDFIASLKMITKIAVTSDNAKKTKSAQALADVENTTKSNFIANLSHEIRTPLGAMISLVHILLGTQVDNEQKKCLTVMQSCAEDLMVLINRSLDIDKIESRITEPEHASFCIDNLLQHIVNIMSVKAQEKGIHLTLDCSAGLNTTCTGDYGRIRQVMMNLVGNAIKFTKAGEVSVLLTLNHKTDGKTPISISVKDTGIGIPADKTGIIFQRFVQADTSIARKFGGTGLGLAISKALAESMGGTLSVTSTVGKGSTFLLNLRLPTTENGITGSSFDQGQIDIRETAYLSETNKNISPPDQQVST